MFPEIIKFPLTLPALFRAECFHILNSFIFTFPLVIKHQFTLVHKNPDSLTIHYQWLTVVNSW